MTNAKRIVTIAKHNQFSSVEKTVIKVVKFLSSKQNQNYHYIINWLNYLQPNLLSKETFSYINKEGKKIEFASNYETWYQQRIKALFHLERFEECIEVCNIALQTIDNFHYNNDARIAIRKYVSLGKLGKIEEAIKVLEEVILKNEF